MTLPKGALRAHEETGCFARCHVDQRTTFCFVTKRNKRLRAKRVRTIRRLQSAKYGMTENLATCVVSVHAAVVDRTRYLLVFVNTFILKLYLKQR